MYFSDDGEALIVLPKTGRRIGSPFDVDRCLSAPRRQPHLAADLLLRAGRSLSEGIMFRSITSVGGTSTNPADFTMTFTAESADPSAQLEAIEDAIEVLEAGGTISSGLANSLSAKLSAAMHQVDHQPHAAANMLTAFIHQVTALVQTGRLSVADGTNLITAAQNLYRRSCELTCQIVCQWPDRPLRA